jgi:hypothetical protein
MTESIFLSTDPRDPNYRLRIDWPDGDICIIREEELTSRSERAQVTETSAHLLLTSEQAEWLHDSLGRMLAERKEESP